MLWVVVSENDGERKSMLAIFAREQRSKGNYPTVWDLEDRLERLDAFCMYRVARPFAIYGLRNLNLLPKDFAEEAYVITFQRGFEMGSVFSTLTLDEMCNATKKERKA